MENKPKICVIMSTYNGEKYLKEQIDSILAQKEVELTLQIFDDVSKDSTVEIAKEYEKTYENVKVHINEKNKNFTYNFLDALFSFKDNQEFDYYAFADQDDYWLDIKLISAIKMIEEKGKCTLYSSNLKVVDSDLNPTGEEMKPNGYKQNHYDALCKNVVTGCTIVMDRDFKNLATKHYPENIYLHDYWLAIIANYCKDANFVYDYCPDYILYRQHGNNAIGSSAISFKKKEYYKTTANLIKTFVKFYFQDIANEDVKIFNKLANIEKFKNRIYLFFKIKSSLARYFKIKLLLKKY